MANSGTTPTKGEVKDPPWPRMSIIRNTQLYTNDIIRFFKHFRVQPPTEEYIAPYVEQRREWTIRHRKIGDQWPIKLRRRMETFRNGFYCPDIVPFVPIGGHFILDPTELILTTLSETTDPRAWQVKEREEQQASTHLQLPKIEAAQQSPKKRDKFIKSKFPRAGYATLKEGIAKSERRVQACSIGYTYSEIAEKMRLEELAREPKKEEDMVLVSLSDLEVLALQQEVDDKSRSEKDETQPDVSIASIDEPTALETQGEDLTTYAYEPVKTLLLDPERCAKVPHSDPTHCAARVTPVPVKPSQSHLEPTPEATVPLPTSSAQRLSSVSKVGIGASFGVADSPRARTTSSSSTVNVVNVANLSTPTPVPPKTHLVVSNQFLELHRERVRRDMLEFLSNCHRFLVALYNMRSKMLRNRTPLTRAALNELMRDRFGKLLYHNEASASNLTNVLRRPSGEVLPPLEQHDTSNPSSNYQLTPNNQEPKLKTRTKCETWEDLINCSTSNTPTELSSSSPSIQAGPKSSRYRMRKKDKLLNHGKDKYALWQYVAMEKQENFFDSSRKKAVKIRAEDVVPELRDAFEGVKETTIQELSEALKKKERDKLLNFKFKFMTAWDNIKSGDIFEFQQRRMRSAVRMIKDRDPIAVPLALWFDEIREKALTVFDVEDPEYKDVMFKLTPLSNFSFKSASFLRAKMCMLVMSLPAYILCQLSAQLALEFIITRVLGGQEASLHQWIRQRKLPVVTALRKQQQQQPETPDTEAD